MLCFFFSSRRRHTRYIGDWSSDVCSSDLWRKCCPWRGAFVIAFERHAIKEWIDDHIVVWSHRAGKSRKARSEERRVGKERRGGSSAYHQKKKKKLIQPDEKSLERCECSRG